MLRYLKSFLISHLYLVSDSMIVRGTLCTSPPPPIAIRSSCRTPGILPVVHRNRDGFGLLAIISASTGKRSCFVVMMYIRLRRINKRNSSQCGSDNINIRTAVCVVRRLCLRDRVLEVPDILRASFRTHHLDFLRPQFYAPIILPVITHRFRISRPALPPQEPRHE